MILSHSCSSPTIQSTYKHYLLRLDIGKGVLLEDPKPKNDILLKDMDLFVCQSKDEFIAKEIHIADIKEQLKIYIDNN